MDPVDETEDSATIDQADDGTDNDPVDIVKVQQDFYESLKNESVNEYSEILNREVLKSTVESVMSLYIKMPEKELNSFTDCLWGQRKYTGSDGLRISQLFVCCLFDSNGELSYPLDLKSSKFTIRPIYRIPKCFKNGTHQRDCCAVFVDEFGRVYKSWNNFRTENKYGNCLIVGPKGGFYDISTNNQVELDIGYQKDGVFKYLDYTSTAASLGSTGVFLAGMIPAITVAPAVATGAVVIGVACAVYTAGRSIHQLVDRKKHEQSIGLGNKESRAAYFNVASGALCAGAAAGARAATQAALNRQTISNVTQKTIRYIGAGSLAFQVCGCADELYGIIKDLRENKPISAVHLAQFGAQIFLLAHSAKSYKLTTTLTEVSGSRNPKTIRRMLRQHNSDGSFKYLFSGADFIEKNVKGLEIASPMMMRSIAIACLNVSDIVKKECEKMFNEKCGKILAQLLEHGHIKNSDFNSVEKILKFFLGTMQLRSLIKLLELTNRFISESTKVHKNSANTNRTIKYEFYLKSIYMLIVENIDDNVNINDFIFVLTHDSFDIMVNEIRSDAFSIVALYSKFHENFSEQLEKDLSLGRVIHLIVEERSQKFLSEFKEFPIRTSLDHLADAIQFVLRRLAIEAATLFFGIAKSILNECLREFVHQKVSEDIFIKELFQMLLKKCSGELRAMESFFKKLLDDKDGSYDRIKKEMIDRFFSRKKDQTLKICSECGGQNFS